MTQVKGKTILFQADFTIHDFGENANDFYCGVRLPVWAGEGGPSVSFPGA